MKIWLSYVSYPVTTAVYFERALRKEHEVITVGPSISDHIIKEWNLENMKLEVVHHNISTDASPDFLDLFNRQTENKKPEFLLWVESVGGFQPRNIEKLPIPKACYLIDSHINLKMHLEISKVYDHVFIAQREYLDDFRKAGIKNVHWLPLGADPEIHSKFSQVKKHDIGFVGSVHPGTRREVLLNGLARGFNLYKERSFWTDMSRVFSESKMVFNNAILNDLNMRFFEVMSTGSFLFCDMAEKSGQDEMFIAGEDYGLYDGKNIFRQAEFYLENDDLREAIALRGMQIVHNAHTYKHRTDEIIKLISGEIKETPDAAEWRKRSLTNITVTTEKINKLKRSFVVPVLDYSPASHLNIKTLLKDLESIEGTLIVIFNSTDVAEDLKNHPRIDYYAVMKKNVGVARAWNIGLDISSTPVTFILNADLSVQKDTVEKLEEALLTLEDCAITGPQGSYFKFETASDLAYYDKGSFNGPTEVDAVSGFLFAVKTKYFHEKLLKFENAYTPCYFEEWDLGLQIRSAGLKSYVVPAVNYQHEWSGSIRALREVKYLDKVSSLGDILERNRQTFLKKWKRISSLMDPESRIELITSKVVKRLIDDGEIKIQEGDYITAGELFLTGLKFFPENPQLLTNLGVVEYFKKNNKAAEEYFVKALDILPDYETAKENLATIRQIRN